MALSLPPATHAVAFGRNWVGDAKMKDMQTSIRTSLGESSHLAVEKKGWLEQFIFHPIRLGNLFECDLSIGRKDVASLHPKYDKKAIQGVIKKLGSVGKYMGSQEVEVILESQSRKEDSTCGYMGLTRVLGTGTCPDEAIGPQEYPDHAGDMSLSVEILTRLTNLRKDATDAKSDSSIKLSGSEYRLD